MSNSDKAETHVQHVPNAEAAIIHSLRIAPTLRIALKKE